VQGDAAKGKDRCGEELDWVVVRQGCLLLDQLGQFQHGTASIHLANKRKE
jgi:hypothetical protein